MRINNNFLVVFTLFVALSPQISICSEAPAENWSYFISPSKMSSALFNVIAENKMILCGMLIGVCGLLVYQKLRDLFVKTMPQGEDIKSFVFRVFILAEYATKGDTESDLIGELMLRYPKGTSDRQELHRVIEEACVNNMKEKFNGDMPIEDKVNLVEKERISVLSRLMKQNDSVPMPVAPKNANLLEDHYNALTKLYNELHQEQQKLITG